MSETISPLNMGGNKEQEQAQAEAAMRQAQTLIADEERERAIAGAVESGKAPIDLHDDEIDDLLSGLGRSSDEKE